MKKPMAAPNRRVLMYFYTAAAVTITIGGSLYGAELKTKQDKQKTAKKDHEATFDEKIQSLKSAREILVSKKHNVERQLQELEERMAEKARKGISSAPNESQHERSSK
ncbi:hypothetical protein UA08_02895 [Talaromyces atroroseus]|uniref:Uncharacterized protein n=1 Tax=Talaromyces atroroseus TaxID=1441469 RepID=A0A225AQH7_TALAT|nr:hypothetical protein UA08_02895 [Talaromyces atroroseus]OKL61753.1 hypothetical protein UA08_02895 [Talaromyces atroroseus]